MEFRFNLEKLLFGKVVLHYLASRTSSRIFSLSGLSPFIEESLRPWEGLSFFTKKSSCDITLVWTLPTLEKIYVWHYI